VGDARLLCSGRRTSGGKRAKHKSGKAQLLLVRRRVDLRRRTFGALRDSVTVQPASTQQAPAVGPRRVALTTGEEEKRTRAACELLRECGPWASVEVSAAVSTDSHAMRLETHAARQPASSLGSAATSMAGDLARAAHK
jgi:hypothetical protein